MDKIVITYKNAQDCQEDYTLEKEDTKIDLFMRQVTSVDLSSVEDCKSLEIIELSRNLLEVVNLNPLSRCTQLKSLRFRENRLSSIDLWPLLKNAELADIDLTGNQLENVDLTPVLSCDSVLLDDSTRVYVDSIFKYLLTLKNISRIKLHHSDRALGPSSPKITWMKYKERTQDNEWSRVYSDVSALIDLVSEENWFPAQRGMLEGFEMSELAGFDGNPKDLLSPVCSDDDYESARSKIFDRAISLLEDQINKNGSTLFLDIDAMSKTRASKLVGIISSLRSEEIENVEVPIFRDTAYLLPLWITHIGFEILSASGYGISVPKKMLNDVINSLASLGYELNTIEASAPLEEIPEHISISLHKHVQSIASVTASNLSESTGLFRM
ncbi:MAG: hypothetical protein ACXADL_01935 [Candidatus Thorarchaeota archaeon]|jgi:hypothetical protein